jgi:hypothetical protein
MITYLQRNHITIFSISLLYTCNILSMESFLPKSLCGYTIKAPQHTIIDSSGNTIITRLKNDCTDALLHILNCMLKPNNDNASVKGSVANIYHDFGINNSIEFVQLINSLAVKTQHDSGVVLAFIDEQRKLHQNVDTTTAFFKAFDDATKVYYFLAEIQNNITHNQSITKEEYAYLLQNMDLLDWKFTYNQFTVTKLFSERFHEAMQIYGGYFRCSAAPSAFFGLFLLDHCKFNNQLGGASPLVMSMLYTTITIAILRYRANNSVPQTQTSTLPTPDALSLEDMSDLIENITWQN